MEFNIILISHRLKVCGSKAIDDTLHRIGFASIFISEKTFVPRSQPNQKRCISSRTGTPYGDALRIYAVIFRVNP